MFLCIDITYFFFLYLFAFFLFFFLFSFVPTNEKVDVSAVRDRLQVGSCNRNKGKGYAKDHRSKNSSLFGGARPREEVLKERGGYQKPSGLRPETWHYVKKSHNNHHPHQNSHPKRLVTTKTKTPSPSLSSFHREGKPHQKHPQYQHLVQHQEGSEEKKEDVTVISNPFEFLASVPSGTYKGGNNRSHSSPNGRPSTTSKRQDCSLSLSLSLCLHSLFSQSSTSYPLSF